MLALELIDDVVRSRIWRCREDWNAHFGSSSSNYGGITMFVNELNGGGEIKRMLTYKHESNSNYIKLGGGVEGQRSQSRNSWTPHYTPAPTPADTHAASPHGKG